MRNTKIIRQVTFRHMKMNAKRTVISIIGIALMVMLLTTVLAGKETAYQYFVDLGTVQNGAYHFAVYDIDREDLNAIKDIRAVDQTGVTEDLKYTWFDKTGNEEKPFLNIRRYSPEAMEWMNIKAVEGRLPENANEIVISKTAVNEGSSVKIGDTIDAETFRRYMINNQESGSTVFQDPFFELPAGEKVELPYNMFYFVPGTEFGDEFYKTHEEIHESTGFKQNYTVVGIIDTPVFEKPGCAWYAAVSYVDESTLTSDTFNALIMTDTNKLNAGFYTQLMDIVGNDYDVNNEVLIFAGNSKENSLNFIVTAAQVFFILLIALISVMLIYNVFALSYDERVKYLGMLSSVGATGKQKRSSVYFEAMVLLVPALPVGILLGLGLTKLAANAVGPMAQKLYVFDLAAQFDLKPALVASPAAIITVIVLSIATVFISALIPARKISKVGPVESIRGNKKRSGEHRKDSNPDRLITKSSEGMLSSRFLKNDKSRSLGIIRAVSIFLLVTVVVYFAASLIIQMVDYKLMDNGFQFAGFQNCDYALMAISGGAGNYDPDAFIENVKTMDGITDFTVCKSSNFSFEIPNGEVSDEYWDGLYKISCLYFPAGEYSREEFDSMLGDWRSTSVQVYALEDEIFGKLAKDLKAESYGSDEMPCILISSASISTDQYGIYGLSARDYKYIEIDDPFKAGAGDELHVSSYAFTRAEAEEKGYPLDEMEFPEIELDGPMDFKVISKAEPEKLKGYIEGNAAMELCMIVPMSTAEYMDKTTVNKFDTMVFFNCDNKDTIERLINNTEDLQNKGEYISVGSTYAGVVGFKAIIAYLIKTVLYIFTAIASAICLLNVYSSISALMVSRRKHFAILRSVGSTFGQLVKTEIRESCGMLIRSVIVAIPVTVLICYWLSKTLIRRFGYFKVSFPWMYTAFLVAAIIAAVLIMTATCLRRENKIDIIDEIKRESV